MSSMLMPKTQKNHMLPMRWNQLPCMNIDVNSVTHAVDPRTQYVSGPSRTRVPGAAYPNNSAGIRPNSHTDLDNCGSLPNPCNSNQASTFRTISPIVAIGMVSVGLLSRSGNIHCDATGDTAEWSMRA